MAVAAAGLAALVAVPTAVAVMLALLLGAVTLDGCEVDSDLGPAEAGMSTSPDGQVVVHPGPCGPGLSGAAVASIRLLGPDGAIAWQADAAGRSAGDAAASDTVVVGQAPPGFVDVVPLAAPLDPESTYEVEMSVLAPGATAGAPPATDENLFAAFGQAATFRPTDLATDTVWYQGRAVTRDAFTTAPCDADGPAGG